MNSVLKHLRFRRFSTVQLLAALVVLLISAPFVEEIEGGGLILSVLFSFVLAVPAITARWVNFFRPAQVHPAVFLVCALLLLAFVIGHLLHFVLRAPIVNVEVLCASIAAYLILGLMWTVAYWLVDQLTPGGAFSFNTNRGAQSMNGFTGFYFSFITLSTVG